MIDRAEPIPRLYLFQVSLLCADILADKNTGSRKGWTEKKIKFDMAQFKNFVSF